MNSVSSPSLCAPPASNARLHLDFLDGVRGLAALGVVVHHLYLARFGMSARSQWPASLGNALLYGHLWVGVFLVVSGFCLALPVCESRLLAGGAIAFYGRRARRILPPFFAALAASIALFWLRHRFAGGEALSMRDVGLNVLGLQDVFPGSNTFNAPLWSVALEWKIYFLFPALLLVWRRFGSGALIGVGTLGGFAFTGLWLVARSNRTWGHSCPWFLALFAIGMAAAGIARSSSQNANRWRARMPSIALLSAVALGVLLWQFPVTGRGELERFVPALPWIDSATGVLAAAALVILAHKRSGDVWKRALQWRPLVAIGTFAYSLYLTHEPLIRLLNFAFEHVPALRGSPLLATLVLFGAGLPLLLGAAFGFFALFERPFLSRHRGR